MGHGGCYTTVISNRLKVYVWRRSFHVRPRTIKNERRKVSRVMDKIVGLTDGQIVAGLQARAQVKAKAKAKGKANAKAKAKAQAAGPAAAADDGGDGGADAGAAAAAADGADAGASFDDGAAAPDE